MTESLAGCNAFDCRVGDDRIAVLVFDDPTREVNLLDQRTMAELEDRLAALGDGRDLAGLIIASGKRSFIAGADVDAFSRVKSVAEGEQLSRWGQRVFALIESLACPTVAAINGTCLGGGLELALACDVRVASDDGEPRLGLPEVQLGIIPGFGGTQRLPRRIGLLSALDLILTGRQVDAGRARRIGLVDDVAPPTELMRGARRALGQVGSLLDARRRRTPRMARLATAFWPLGRLFVNVARKKTLKASHGHYPAPLKALEVLATGLSEGLSAGYAAEARAVGELLISPESHHLVRVFQLMQGRKKEVQQQTEGVAAVERAAVFGAGVMGSGIASVMTRRNIEVRVKDVAWPPLAGMMKTLASDLRRRVKRRQLRPHQAMAAVDRVSLTTAPTGFARAQVAVEAATEQLELKRRLLSEMARVCGPDTLLATNTSSLSLAALSDVLERPDRLVGLHFFNPVARMPLVEVIRDRHTDRREVARALALAMQLGKIPIEVSSGPGFLVNRILAPYLNEAAWLAVEGNEPDDIDAVLEEFGWPMGPFRLLDEVGLDVAQAVGRVMAEGFGERMVAPPLVDGMVARGLLGRKGGRGFYAYSGRRRRVSPEVRGELARLRGASRPCRRPDRIVDRAVLAMANEAVRCLDEGVVAGEDVIDLASVLGLGFPPFRGGLICWATERGRDVVRACLEELARECGERFAPAGGWDMVDRDRHASASA